jgi:hypothetical protein
MPVIDRVLVQEKGGGRMLDEMRVSRDEFLRRGLPVETFTPKRLRRGLVVLSPRTLVVGDLEAVPAALRQLDVPYVAPATWPACLAGFLRRRTWTTTLRALRQAFADAPGEPVFVKPLRRTKRFPGLVVGTAWDLGFVADVSAGTELACSEVVRWLSEYRVYVVRGEIVGTHHYRGDVSVGPDPAVVRAAVDALAAAGDAPAGCAVDVGVLDGGETALVELNDGLGLGCYGLAAGDYCDLLTARWAQLVEQGRRG